MSVFISPLMIVGNKSAGGCRKVSMWDQLTINGTLVVTSTIGASGDVIDARQRVAAIRLSMACNTFPMSVSGTPFVCTIGESMTIRKWQQAIYVAGTTMSAVLLEHQHYQLSGDNRHCRMDHQWLRFQCVAVYSNSYCRPSIASDKIWPSKRNKSRLAGESLPRRANGVCRMGKFLVSLLIRHPYTEPKSDCLVVSAFRARPVVASADCQTVRANTRRCSYELGQNNPSPPNLRPRAAKNKSPRQPFGDIQNNLEMTVNGQSPCAPCLFRS